MSIVNKVRRLVDNEFQRIDWVEKQLKSLNEGNSILDAGCGSQQYRKYCDHLKYYAQDYGGYSTDEKNSFAASDKGYQYGDLDYKGNIWEIDEKDEDFDAILCTEVLEHIPYPQKTLKEFSRLLKPKGKLILTFPSNCLRHMDPYFFSSGYSDHFIEYFLAKYQFEVVSVEPVGSYYNWLMVEVFRTMRNHGFISRLLLMPAFLYYYFKQKSPNEESVNTLCSGYHVIARKK